MGTYMIAVIAAWICSLSIAMATECEDVCLYTVEDVHDVNCYRRNLTHLPQGCHGAWTLEAGNNSIQALDLTTFKSFTSLKNLYMSRGVIETIIPGALAPFAETIQMISLPVNRIARLENGTFVGMSKLGQLDLQRNHIESVEPLTFRDLSALMTLWLSHNHLSELPAAVFDGIPALTVLHLQGNRLWRIDSRLFLNLQSLTEINLYSNEITALTGTPLGSEGGGSLRLAKIALSQNNLTDFDCDWIGQLPVKVNLSFNLMERVSNCRLQLENLTLVQNPFDCGCGSEVISGVYKAKPELIPPTCRQPPEKRNRTIAEITYDECHYQNVHSTGRPKVKTTTVQFPENSQTTTKHHQQAPKTTRLIAPTEQSEILTSPGLPLMGEQSSLSSFFTGERQIYAILTIVAVGLVFVLLILFLSYRLIKKNRSNGAGGPDHNCGAAITNSASHQPSRQGTGRSSHLYAEIPADDSVRVDQNLNHNIAPRTRVCSESEIEQNHSHIRTPRVRSESEGVEQHCPHPRVPRVRSESEGFVQSCSHNCSHHCLGWRDQVQLSDSQDSGLADQGRPNSLQEWLQIRLDNSPPILECSCCDCEQCYYLSVKGRDSWDSRSSFIPAQQQRQWGTSAVIAMSDLPPTRCRVGGVSSLHDVGEGSSTHGAGDGSWMHEEDGMSPMHRIGGGPPVHLGPTAGVGRLAPTHEVGQSLSGTAYPQRHHQHPSTSHGGEVLERQRCNSCHKFRPADNGSRTDRNQLEPGRRKTRKRDSSGYVAHNLIK